MSEKKEIHVGDIVRFTPEPTAREGEWDCGVVRKVTQVTERPEDAYCEVYWFRAGEAYAENCISLKVIFEAATIVRMMSTGHPLFVSEKDFRGFDRLSRIIEKVSSG